MSSWMTPAMLVSMLLSAETGVLRRMIGIT